MTLPIITIDGPSGVGKTTLARLIAEKLAIPHLDSGAMFRILALVLGEEALITPQDELRKQCAACRFTLNGAGSNSLLQYNGISPGQEIRSPEISSLASRLGVNQEIRSVLLKAQREIGAQQPLVTEGRDMGTVVFPEAAVKFFLDADPLIRARRRLKDLEAVGRSENIEELAEQIRTRDERDRSRSIAPLKAADDAIIIDSTNLDVQGVLHEMLAHIRKRPEFFPQAIQARA